LARVAQFVTTGFTRHDLTGAFPAKSEGDAEVTNFLEVLWRALPDLRFDIQDILACDERIAMRFQISGTHTAELFGASPTGRRVEFSAINMYRFEENKMAELWQLWDWAAVLRQIGLLNIR
jgi:predicted ester cyclase